MSKDYLYWGKDDEWVLRLVNERVEEEGCGRSNTLKALIISGLGVSDPREGVEGRDEQAGTLGTSLRLTEQLWVALSEERIKRKLKMAACIRACLMDYFKLEPPPKPVRAPRNRELSEDAMMAHHIDSFTTVRNVRSSEEDAPIWEEIRANPKTMFLVNLCRVKKCPNQDLGLHKHPGNQLADYAEAVEAGGRT